MDMPAVSEGLEAVSELDLPLHDPSVTSASDAPMIAGYRHD
jgi:hypothetical protein